PSRLPAFPPPPFPPPDCLARRPRWRRNLTGSLLAQRRGSHHSAQPHRFDDVARHNHQRALFLEALVQDVHRAEVERRRIVLVRLRGLEEEVRDLHFRLPEYDARRLLT